MDSRMPDLEVRGAGVATKPADAIARVQAELDACESLDRRVELLDVLRVLKVESISGR